MRKENSMGIFTVVKGVGVALLCSLLLALLFSVILQVCNLSNKIIYPVNQAIKGLSIAVGALLFVRGEKGWLKGGGIGLLFTALSYLAFSAIGGDFSLSWLILAELLFAAFVGALCGIIGVNLRR